VVAVLLQGATPRLALARPQATPDAGDEPDIEITEDAPAPDAAPPAEPPPLDPKEIKRREKVRSKLVKDGDALLKKNDPAGALAKYEEAYALLPTPLLFYPMAKAEEKAGRPLEAIAHYERFLSEAAALISNEDIRVDAQVSVQELDKTIVAIVFEIRPDGAEVILDGKSLGPAPIESKVRVLPGRHTLVIQKEGFVKLETGLDTEAGEVRTERRSLAPIKTKVTAPEPEPEPETPLVLAPRPSRRQTIILWTGVGLTSASFLAWAVTGSLALGNHDTFSDPANAKEDRASARDSGETMALASDVFLLSTLACGGFTAWWYYKVVQAPAEPSPRQRRRERAPAVPGGDDDDPAELRGQAIVPWAAKDGGGLTWMGTF
jgi:hypothetical protein